VSLILCGDTTGVVSFGKALKKHRVVIALFSGQGVYGQKNFGGLGILDLDLFS